MATVSRDQVVAADAAHVWDVLVDWPRHGGWVPMTSVEVLTPQVAGVGARFVGRTRLVPFTRTPLARMGFDDVMEVTGWQPPQAGRPGRCEVLKQGRVVTGRAVLEVHPLGPHRCRVIWTYHDLAVHPTAGRGPVWLRRGLARVGEPLTGALTGPGLHRVLAAMAADIESDTVQPP